MPRRQYFDLYGPTVGDRVRLADTELYIEIERDLLTYGDEAVFGGGKTIRDGMGQDSTMTNANGALDLVITNVIVLDPVLGVLKADIGIKGGRIVDIGKAGNPKTMHGVSPKLVIGAGTEVISGEHLIATPAAIDTHIHLISPQQVYHALSNGTTTFIGGGTGPADGTNATTCTPGPWNMARMLQAIEGWPINVGLLGKGASSAAPLREQIEAGAVGFKDHEDWGATPAVIDASLQVADEYDVQVSLHSDTLNESGFLEDTIAAIGGRAIHSYHTEGAGGGHAPDIIAIAGEPNVLPASTNPTRPYTVNTLDEHLDMLIVCHHLNASVPEDVAFAESRIRAETIAAEDVLHDWGVLSMYSSDSQAMGRVGETFTRLIQTADKMKKLAGKLPEDSPRHDNFRVLRYLAKLTINPAIAHGISHVVGSLQPGKLADIILWSPAFFAAKPKMVIKGGLINWSLMGDPNASIPTPQPVYYRPMFGTLGKALPSTCVTFVSQAAYELGIREKLRLERIVEPVRNCRAIGKADMVRNDKTPRIEVNPETYEVRVDGQRATVAPAKELALTQRYFLT